MPTDDEEFDDEAGTPDEAPEEETAEEQVDDLGDDESPEVDDATPARPDGSTVLRRRLGVALVLTLVAVAAGWYFVLRDDDGLSDGAVLAVDGQELTEEQFERRLDLLTALYGVQVPEPDSDRHDQFRRDSAKSIAVGVVLENTATDRGIEIAERTVTDAFARYVEQQYPVGGRNAFTQALGNVGVSEAEVLAEFRRTLITRLLYNDVVEPVTVSDDELVTEYEERKDELGISETRSIRHLVVSTEEAAQAAKSRIEAGEDFATVAREVSLDGATAADGGNLGAVSADMLDPKFAEPAFSAQPGTVFGPVRTDLGFYLGVVDEVFPPRTPSLDEIAEQLRTRIRVERELEQWRQFLEQAIADADITYADEYEPEDPDAPPPVVLPDPLSPTTTSGAAPETTGEGG